MSVIISCALGWSGYLQCKYEDGKILCSKKTDLLLNEQYYRHAPNDLNAWPIDPATGEKLPMDPYKTC